MDFDKVLGDFVMANPTNNNGIKEIKEMFNPITLKQLDILYQLLYYANKWECEDITFFVENYKKDMAHKGISNGLFGTNVNRMLKTYSLEEYFKGINASAVKKMD